MAGLLAAEIAAEGAHFFDDVTIADRSAMQRDIMTGEKPLETEIGHDSGNQRATREPSAPRQPRRDQRHQLVAVLNKAAFVRDDQPIGVAVECNPDIRPPRQNLAPHLSGDKAPHSRFMLRPSGETPSEKTSAPSSQKTVGATL